MLLIRTVEEMKGIARTWHAEGKSIALVPSMGSLHAGHESLMEAARRTCDKVVVSVFVNPIQFGPDEDYDSYPRDIERDARICESKGVDAVFHPAVEEMYPEGYSTYVEVEGLTERLCGAVRPGHFRGVCTVVTKLFNIVDPDRAFFGQKDAQQLAVIKRMVADLNMDVRIIGCPIVREEDGLAKSSRNSYLSREEREASLILSRSLAAARESIEQGERDVSVLESLIRTTLEAEPLASVDYIEIVDGLALQPIARLGESALIALAVYIGSTRLIDNLVFEEGSCS